MRTRGLDTPTTSQHNNLTRKSSHKCFLCFWRGSNLGSLDLESMLCHLSGPITHLLRSYDHDLDPDSGSVDEVGGETRTACGEEKAKDTAVSITLWKERKHVARSDTRLTKCQFGQSGLLIPTERAIQERELDRRFKTVLNANVKLWTLKVRWKQSGHFEKMELKGYYTALVKVDFCHLKCVWKSLIGRNGPWAVRLW